MEEIKKILEQFKNRVEVENITRVEKSKDIIKIYYTLTREFQKTNELSYRNRIFEYNLNKDKGLDYADMLKVDI